MGISAIALFCEDIREEKSGQDILVGILPDNLEVARGPAPGVGMFSKLGIYIRMHLDANDSPPRQVSARLVLSDGVQMPLQAWDQETVNKAFMNSKENGMPLVGLVMKVVAAPFQIRTAGKITAVVDVEGREYIAGALNVIFSDPNASTPPA